MDTHVGEHGFHLVFRDEPEDKSRSSATKPNKKFSNLYSLGKNIIVSSIYNLYQPNEIPPFSESPIFLLGRCYKPDEKQDDYDDELQSPIVLVEKNKTGQRPAHIEAFLADFSSLIWLPYRRDFPPLGPSKLTTDLGWGCMLRSGQMMLAQAYVRLCLGRDWRLDEESMSPYSKYRNITRWFTDYPTSQNTFSIHNLYETTQILENGEPTKLKPGEWFTPSRISNLLKNRVKLCSPESLCMYVPTDGVIYIDKATKVCTTPTSERNVEFSAWRPLFILIPLRLGVESLNKVYIPCLKKIFEFPQSLGLIGGKPKLSFYIVGIQDESVFYLDPHIVRPTPKPDQPYDPQLFHSGIPNRMLLESMDPSLGIGFFCKDKPEFDDLCQRLQQLGNLSEYPMISVENVRPRYSESDNDDSDDLMNDLVII